MREKAGLKMIWGMLILFLLVLLPGQIASAKEIKPIKIDEKHFPDEKIRWEISEAYDKNKDGMLSKNEIKKAKEFWIINYDTLEPYLNLSGLEYLPYLKSVRISHYKIKQKDLNRYPFTKAKRIDMTNNHMKSMDFSACKNLEELECNGQSNLRKIVISNNKKLKNLKLESCHQLKNINISKNKKIKSVDLKECYQLKNVDISKNDKLERFSLDENHIKKTLIIQGAKSLKFLGIYRCQITGLEVNNCPKLRKVVMSSVPHATVLDLQNCPNVNNLYLGSPLSELHVSNKDAIKNFVISSTKLELEEIEEYKNLESLGIYDTQLLEFNASPWKKLKELSVNGCSSLQRLDVSGLDDLEYLNADGTFLTSLDLSGKIELKELVCANRYLEELNLTGIDNLRKVLAYGVLHKNPLKKIILDADVSKKDLEYIQRQQEWADFDPPELVFV